MITLSLDAMSGDRGPDVVVRAAKLALNESASLRVILVGDPTLLQSLVATNALPEARVSIKAATQVVTMEDSAADAIRRKKDSSMRLAIDLVKTGAADACVSAGNTGALMACAKFVLKTVPGIDRPAIVTEVPSHSTPVFMLDLGANADCSPEQLHQFAIMGKVLARDVTGNNAPRIGLLNIGAEQSKGDETVKETAARLSDDPRINYVGFVEGNAIFEAKADVVVTDGFTGNVALKTMEGTAALVSGFIRDAFTASASAKFQALLAGPVLRGLKARLDPRHYNGATFIGLNGIVVKSHGGADEIAFQHAIETAVLEAEAGVIAHIGQQLDRQ